MSIRKNGARIIATKGQFKGCIGTVSNVKKSSFNVYWERALQVGWTRYSNLDELKQETGASLLT
jgi:hypothetical protein